MTITMDTFSKWFGIAFFSTLTLLGFVITMWFPIRYSWGRKNQEKLTGMQKLKFSISVGGGLSISLSAFFALVVLVLSNPNNAELSLDKFGSLFNCIIPLAIVFGIVAAFGTYLNFSWLDWLVRRSSKPKSEG